MGVHYNDSRHRAELLQRPLFITDNGVTWHASQPFAPATAPIRRRSVTREPGVVAGDWTAAAAGALLRGLTRAQFLLRLATARACGWTNNVSAADKQGLRHRLRTHWENALPLEAEPTSEPSSEPPFV